MFSFGYTLIFILINLSNGLESWEQNDQILEEKECSTRPFSTSCPEGKLIVVTSAFYGRPRIDELCVRSSYKLGCGTNVTRQLDEFCSGRPSCDFEFRQPLKQISDCPADTDALLTVQFRCQAVYSPVGIVCKEGSSVAIDLTSRTDLLLSKYYSQDRTIGSPTCPWLIYTEVGQLFTITVVNFKHRFQPDGLNQPLMCHRYARVQDGPESTTIDWCERAPYENRNRTQLVYTSKTNSITLEILTQESTDIYYFLYVQAIGCPNLFDPSPGLWLRVHTDGFHGTVRCNHSSEEWPLLCREGRWNGPIGTCNSAHGRNLDMKNSGTMGSSLDFPLGILIVVAVGVALGVFLGGLLLICFSRHMKSKHNARMREAHYVPASSYFSEGDIDQLREKELREAYIASSYYEKGAASAATRDSQNHCYGTVPPPHCQTLNRAHTALPMNSYIYDTREQHNDSTTSTCTHYSCHTT